MQFAEAHLEQSISLEHFGGFVSHGQVFFFGICDGNIGFVIGEKIIPHLDEISLIASDSASNFSNLNGLRPSAAGPLLGSVVAGSVG